MVNGYETELIEEPKYVSRGEWTLTGTDGCQAFTPLKRAASISSGLWGASGVYYTRQYATVYDDISGISGCIGVSLDNMLPDSATGMDNINRPMFRRQIDVCHFGIIKLPYVSGTLDGTPVTLKWGDLIAPCISGFRAFEELNHTLISGDIGTATLSGDFLHTGLRQQVFGHYMDTPSDQTGTTGFARKKVFIYPNTIYGVHK